MTDTFPRENIRWEEEEIVLCVQVLTTCSGKQWWCPNCKVGLSVCIEAPVTIGWSYGVTTILVKFSKAKF
jgi:hypothetical protein